MSVRRLLLKFLVGFSVGYGLLIVPWPGWDRLYSIWLGRLGGAIYTSATSRWDIRFIPVPAPSAEPLNLRITLENRARPAADGQRLMLNMDLDARSIGWIPTAMLIALICASPLPWRRRARALGWGLLAVHLAILLAMGLHIVDCAAAGPQLALVVLNPFWHTFADVLDDTLITQLGFSFVLPVVLWIACTFQIADRALFLQPVAGRKRRFSYGQVTS